MKRIVPEAHGSSHPVWQVLVCACDDARGYSFPADVWAAGCVLYCVVSGHLDDSVGPFSPQQDDDVAAPLAEVFASILEARLSLDHLPDLARVRKAHTRA